MRGHADIVLQSERELLQDQISRENSSTLDQRQDESVLLQDLVAQYLAHDGFIETAKAFGDEVQSASSLLRPRTSSSRTLEYKEDLNAINRQRKYRCVRCSAHH